MEGPGVGEDDADVFEITDFTNATPWERWGVLNFVLAAQCNIYLQFCFIYTDMYCMHTVS